MKGKWLLNLLSAIILVSCTKDKSSDNTSHTFNPIFEHVIVIFLENHSYSQIINNNDAPFINSLIDQPHTVIFSNSHGITHPSQPNYICFFSGASQGISSNFPALNTPFTTPNLGAYLIQNGYTFKGYCEDLPSVGYTGVQYNNYVRPLNPWVNWQGNSANSIPPESNQPFTSFTFDFSTLPNVSIIIPNLLHNMHDGSVADCDNWLKNNFTTLTQSAANTNNLFILTFDEDDDSPVNHILTLAVSKNLAKATNDQNINHYNLLRTIEENFKLPYAGTSADSTVIKVLLQ